MLNIFAATASISPIFGGDVAHGYAYLWLCFGVLKVLCNQETETQVPHDLPHDLSLVTHPLIKGHDWLGTASTPIIMFHPLYSIR